MPSDTSTTLPTLLKPFDLAPRSLFCGFLRKKSGETVVATGAEDSTVRLWDLRAKPSSRVTKCLCRCFDGEAITSIVFRPGDSNRLFCSAGSKVLLVPLGLKIYSHLYHIILYLAYLQLGSGSHSLQYPIATFIVRVQHGYFSLRSSKRVRATVSTKRHQRQTAFAKRWWQRGLSHINATPFVG